MRGSFEGVQNIIRFNWHFYVIAFLAVVAIMAATVYVPAPFGPLLFLASFSIVATTLTSLIVSYVVYDRSDLYKLNWTEQTKLKDDSCILTIHAGFDEISPMLRDKFPGSSIAVFDFYDSQKHTEVSIKRARKVHPPSPESTSVNTDRLPLPDRSIHASILFLAAHEIRDEQERILFFQEIRRAAVPGGQVIVTEHLRDLPNFLAYNIGFLHFHSRKTWMTTFTSAGFKLVKEIKTTPFITTFILATDGSTP